MAFPSFHLSLFFAGQQQKLKEGKDKQKKLNDLARIFPQKGRDQNKKGEIILGPI